MLVGTWLFSFRCYSALCIKRMGNTERPCVHGRSRSGMWVRRAEPRDATVAMAAGCFLCGNLAGDMLTVMSRRVGRL